MYDAVVYSPLLLQQGSTSRGSCWYIYSSNERYIGPVLDGIGMLTII